MIPRKLLNAALDVQEAPVAEKSALMLDLDVAAYDSFGSRWISRRTIIQVKN